ncbi:hypothetical protein C8F01DRAFT_1247432 [Mycena amicta]|nr:hypothetical protein C8F01DRAFT_1247432 [Mycena amicta]
MQTITDLLKPHRSEALFRLRASVSSIILICLLSFLVPRVPALPTALAVARNTSLIPSKILMARIEVGVIALLSINIVQSIFALRYPRAPIPPSPAPAKTKGFRVAPATPQRILNLSPNSSPQPQKSFSFSTSAYPPSPLSTPSRVLQYSMAPGSSTSSLMSSTSTLNTPSPILSSYHGKHTADYLARSFDGACLSEIRQRPESDEE